MSASNRRLAASAAVGLVIAAGVAFALPWQVAVLLGWCAAALTFLGQVGRGVASLNAAESKELATAEDPTHLAADAALIAAAGASLVGVGFVLVKAGESSGMERGLTAALGVVSVALAWTTLQTIFMLRYARLFYEDPAGGVDFGSKEPPDYHDFAYLAFTVGMTFQVSDTAITSRPVRRTVLRHALLSFVFFTAFVAVLINVVGGLF